jgi:5-methylcytosine-specific restriction endonuclease McrA
MPALYKKTCEECCKVYEVQKHRLKISRFCSMLCLNKNNAKKNTKHPRKICVTCGKEFYGSRISCSPECTPHPKGKRIIKYCKGCNKKLELQPSRAFKNFCSKECHASWRIGEKRKQRIVKICLICKKEFKVLPSREDKKYCKRCDGRHYEQAYTHKRIRGENHSWYTVGTTEKEYGRNWKEQAQKARKRDRHTCQVCGCKRTKDGRKLSVHHITPRRNFKTLEELEEKGNALINLITLCQSCHAKVESNVIAIQSRLC